MPLPKSKIVTNVTRPHPKVVVEYRGPEEWADCVKVTTPPPSPKADFAGGSFDRFVAGFKPSRKNLSNVWRVVAGRTVTVFAKEGDNGTETWMSYGWSIFAGDEPQWSDEKYDTREERWSRCTTGSSVTRCSTNSGGIDGCARSGLHPGRGVVVRVGGMGMRGRCGGYPFQPRDTCNPRQTRSVRYPIAHPS